MWAHDGMIQRAPIAYSVNLRRWGVLAHSPSTPNPLNLLIPHIRIVNRLKTHPRGTMHFIAQDVFAAAVDFANGTRPPSIFVTAYLFRVRCSRCLYNCPSHLISPFVCLLSTNPNPPQAVLRHFQRQQAIYCHSSPNTLVKQKHRQLVPTVQKCATDDMIRLRIDALPSTALPGCWPQISSRVLYSVG